MLICAQGSKFIAVQSRSHLQNLGHLISKLHQKLCTRSKFQSCATKDKKVGYCPLRQGKILTQGFNSNNLDTGPPNNVSCQISKLYLSQIQKTFVLSFCFNYVFIMKINAPGQGQFWHQGQNLNDLLMISYSKHQSSKLCTFRQDDF
jgi:hypothetical protein